jgi:hypothetical protein
MKLTLVKGELDDWYTIERAEHENIRELRPHPSMKNVTSLYYSGRISDACVEGTSLEMMAIARAIAADGEAHFKRCAVKPSGDGFLFWSPRNSMEEAFVPGPDARELADEIKARLFLET